MKILLLILSLSFMTQPALGSSNQKATRFDAEQLKFQLVDTDGSLVACDHKLLSHVPWWRVSCGEREFTVDVWVDIVRNPSRDLSKISLMYSVSEGVRSSGERLVQFNDHFSSFVFAGNGPLSEIGSSLDVQNGLASLDVQIKL